MTAHGSRVTTRSGCLGLAFVLVGSGCMALTPQLPPTDFAALEQVDDRDAREQLYREQQIVRHEAPQGERYTKGDSPYAERRSWQSLDKILRSDATSAAALPEKTLRISRVFTALTIAASMVTVAGVAASAREGLDLRHPDAGGGLLLGGGIGVVAFAITAGILYGRAQKGYQRAVNVYNDSLAMRLGLNTPQGAYIPPKGVLVDDEGFILMNEPERRDSAAKPVPEGPAAPPEEPEASTTVPPTAAPPPEAQPRDPSEPVSTEPASPGAAPPDPALPREAPPATASPEDPAATPEAGPQLSHVRPFQLRPRTP